MLSVSGVHKKISQGQKVVDSSGRKLDENSYIRNGDLPLVSGEMRSHFDMLLTEMTDHLEVTPLVAKISTDAISAAALQQVIELLNYIHHERFENSSANNLIAVKLIDWIKK